MLQRSTAASWRPPVNRRRAVRLHERRFDALMSFFKAQTRTRKNVGPAHEELHQLAWSELIRTLRGKFGISDVCGGPRSTTIGRLGCVQNRYPGRGRIKSPDGIKG